MNYSILHSDPTGITNLAKIQSNENNTAFVKLVIDSKFDQIKKFDFGFANKVKLFLNGQIIFAGDDNFQSRD